MKGWEKNEHIWRGNRIGGLSGITECGEKRKAKGRGRTERKKGANNGRDGAERQEETGGLGAQGERERWGDTNKRERERERKVK